MTLRSRIISKKTREVLENDVVSIIAIMNKIANPRKIARRILPLIKKNIEFEPKLESVAKVVERYVKEVEKTGKLSGYDIGSIHNLLTKTKITLQSDIAVIVMRISKDIEKTLTKIIQSVYSDREKPFINITFGYTYASIMIDQSNLEKAVKIIGKKNIVYARKNQVAIGVITPPDVLNLPGYTAYVLSLLSISGVNIVDLLSSYTEGMLISDEEDAQKAYAILRSEIDKLRKYHEL